MIIGELLGSELRDYALDAVGQYEIVSTSWKYRRYPAFHGISPF